MLSTRSIRLRCPPSCSPLSPLFPCEHATLQCRSHASSHCARIGHYAAYLGPCGMKTRGGDVIPTDFSMTFIRVQSDCDCIAAVFCIPRHKTLALSIAPCLSLEDSRWVQLQPLYDICPSRVSCFLIKRAGVSGVLCLHCEHLYTQNLRLYPAESKTQFYSGNGTLIFSFFLFMELRVLLHPVQVFDT